MNSPWNPECILKSWMHPEILNAPCNPECALKSRMHTQTMNLHPEIMNAFWNHECILKSWMHPEIMNAFRNHECILKFWGKKFLSSIKELLNIWSTCSESNFFKILILKMFSAMEKKTTIYYRNLVHSWKL